MNYEYEYSFMVKDIKDFINYCVVNNYEKTDEYMQVRTLYKNGGAVMGRVTENIYNDKVEKILNFKDDKLTDNVLKVARETEDLIITDDNQKFVESLLNILELNDKKILKRQRYVYVKNNVKFEIDEYTEPAMNVVAIEGNKEEVDIVYSEIENIKNINSIN